MCTTEQLNIMYICTEDSIITDTVFAGVSARESLNSLVGRAIIRNHSLVVVDTPFRELVYFGGRW